MLPFVFQRATPSQVADVLDVLTEVATWLEARGVHQWPTPFQASWLEPAIARGETWLVRADDRLAATVTLTWSDDCWSDLPCDAGYVHRLAVRRGWPGLGAVILQWARGETQRQGRSMLRLDCVADNQFLRAYYENEGFHHQGDVQVTPPGNHPPIVVARYEQLLPPP